MKGLLLVGGTGSRLHPITKVVNKHLLPIYDKPMCFYSLSILINSGIKDILVISTEKDKPLFKELLGDGSQWGVNLEYAIQNVPKGIAEAIIIGKEFIGDDSVMLVLGDNIIHGDKNFYAKIEDSINRAKLYNLSTIFGYKVKDSSKYGVAEFNEDGNIIGLEEKPLNSKSDRAIVGVYCYPNSVVDYVNDVVPSKRGELEITSLNEIYLKKGELVCECLDVGVCWLDSGTYESLLQAGEFVAMIQERTGIKIGL